MMTVRRVLVCRGGALGDLLLTFPALRAIRHAWPKAAIVLAAYPPQARLALVGGWVDELVSLDSADTAEWFASGTGLSSEQTRFLGAFDLAISWLHDPEGLVAARLRQAGIGRVLTQSPLVTQGHAIDHFMAVLGELGISQAAGIGAALELPEAVVRGGAEMTRLLGRRVVALHPGSGSASKNWPLERFMQLAEQLRNDGDSQPVFLLGPAEAGMEVRLEAHCPQIPRFKELDLTVLAGMLANCEVYVGNDSGVSHLAAALGIPVMVLFGPTHPDRWAPRGQNVQVIDAVTATPDRLFAGLKKVGRT